MSSTSAWTAGLSTAELARVAETLRVMAHPVRLRVLEFLRDRGAQPVGAIAAAIGRAPAATSQHLTQMRRQGLVSASRRGREVWYRMDNPRVARLLRCVCAGGCGGREVRA